MIKNRALYSWALYDFANTIFSAVVLTFYFPLYLTGLTQQNLSLGIAATAAMILAGGVVPWLGLLSDRTGQTKSYLIGSTLLCVGFTLSLSLFTSIPLLIATFLFAAFFFHASLVFYNALLPVVAKPETQGFASGAGTALGYLGVVFSIPIAQFISTHYGQRFVFLSAGLLFFFFSLPLFLWVPERKSVKPIPVSVTVLIQSASEVGKTALWVAQKRPLLCFFLGNFFVMEAMNTVIFWLILYTARVFQPPESVLMFIFLGLNFSAFLGGLAAGFLTDRWSSKNTLLVSVLSLFGTLLILGLTKNLPVFVMVSLIGGGFGFAGIWTAGRKCVVELAPPEEVGRYFGLYNLTTKVSVIWNLIFSGLADRFGFPSALLSLCLPSGIGLFFLLLSRTDENEEEVS